MIWDGLGGLGGGERRKKERETDIVFTRRPHAMRTRIRRVLRRVPGGARL